jgi:uncharacterized UPF0160 family protein
MIKTIVTHPGGAHKDDLLAVCVLIAGPRCSGETRLTTTSMTRL